MKKRLKYITELINDTYNEIWDTCCDHGKLGIELLQTRDVNRVHFVDCVPKIMEKLKTKLNDKKIEPTSYQIHIKEAQDIELLTSNSLICICGVGGVTAIDIISGLLRNSDLLQHELLLSVQYKTPRLREYLHKSGFKVVEEKLCFEGKWANEIMLISKRRGYKIDLVGSKMYDLSDKQHINHLLKSIKHYKRKSITDKKFCNITKLYESIQAN